MQQHSYEMRTVSIWGLEIMPISRGELFCKPFVPIDHNRVTAGYNWYYGHSLFMIDCYIIVPWEQ